MFKTLWVTVLLGVMAALAAGGLFGFDSALVSAAAIRNRFIAAWENGKSELQQAAEIGVRVDAQNGECARMDKRLATIEVTLETCREKAKQLESELEQEEELLGRARMLLASPKDRIVIGGRAYTPDEVTADAGTRVEYCKRLQAKLAQTREQGKQLAAVLREGQEAVRVAREQQQTLQARLDALRTRLDQAQLRQRMADLTQGLRGSSSDCSAKLSESLESLDTKVRVLEREIQQDAASAATGLIDWDGKRSPRTSREVRASIDEYFSSQEDEADVDR